MTHFESISSYFRFCWNCQCGCLLCAFGVKWAASATTLSSAQWHFVQRDCLFERVFSVKSLYCCSNWDWAIYRFKAPKPPFPGATEIRQILTTANVGKYIIYWLLLNDLLIRILKYRLSHRFLSHFRSSSRHRTEMEMLPFIHNLVSCWNSLSKYQTWIWCHFQIYCLFQNSIVCLFIYNSVLSEKRFSFPNKNTLKKQQRFRFGWIWRKNSWYLVVQMLKLTMFCFHSIDCFDLLFVCFFFLVEKEGNSILCEYLWKKHLVAKISLRLIRFQQKLASKMPTKFCDIWLDFYRFLILFFFFCIDVCGFFCMYVCS